MCLGIVWENSSLLDQYGLSRDFVKVQILGGKHPICTNKNLLLSSRTKHLILEFRLSFLFRRHSDQESFINAQPVPEKKLSSKCFCMCGV